MIFCLLQTFLRRHWDSKYIFADKFKMIDLKKVKSIVVEIQIIDWFSIIMDDRNTTIVDTVWNHILDKKR
jgi:hypothetical protein